MTHDDGELLMGRWDCDSCGAKGQRGDSYQCQSCGARRPEDVEFYLPQQDEVITDAAQVAAAEAGADWQCAFCSSWMPATDETCRGCHASHAESIRRQQTGEYRPGGGPVHHIGDDAPIAVHHIKEDDVSNGPSSKTPLFLIAGFVALAAILVAGYGFNRVRLRQDFEARVAEQKDIVQAAQAQVTQVRRQSSDLKQRLAKAELDAKQASNDVRDTKNRIHGIKASLDQLNKAVPVTVASHNWRVKLDLEQCNAKPGEGWDHPANAFDVKSQMREHPTEKELDRVDTLYRTETYRTQDGFTTETYTERVKTGTRKVQSGTKTTNLGNGRFRRTPTYRNEPVYQNVTKTRQKPKMVTKTRRVPYQKKVYRKKKKPYYSYRTRVWQAAPALTREGEGLDPEDPEDAPPKDVKEEVGAKRLRQKTITYLVKVKGKGDAVSSVSLAADRWKAIKAGDSMLMYTGRLVTTKDRDSQVASLNRKLSEVQPKLAPLEARSSKLTAAVPPLRNEYAPYATRIRQLEQAASNEQARLHHIMSSGY